jgi:hypothetical protein
MTQPWSLLKAGTPLFTVPRATMVRRCRAGSVRGTDVETSTLHDRRAAYDDVIRFPSRPEACVMNFVLQPWQLLVAILAGWVHRQQQAVIDSQRTEIQILSVAEARIDISAWTVTSRSL